MDALKKLLEALKALVPGAEKEIAQYADIEQELLMSGGSKAQQPESSTDQPIVEVKDVPETDSLAEVKALIAALGERVGAIEAAHAARAAEEPVEHVAKADFDRVTGQIEAIVSQLGEIKEAYAAVKTAQMGEPNKAALTPQMKQALADSTVKKNMSPMFAMED